MKKTIYISGIIIANLLVLGCIFKINHWPGAGVLLTTSLLALSLWFLPVSLINHYKGEKNKTGKWIYISAFISFFMVFIAALFKIQHWSGAGLLLLIGVPIPFLIFLPSFIFYSVKNKDQSFVNFTGIILGLIIIAVYGVLLSLNVSRDVLFKGIQLTKSNEKVIDYYEFTTAKYKNLSNKEMQEVVNRSETICKLIHKAKSELLTYTDNENINSGDLGKDDYRIENLKNLDSKTISKYVLIWKDDALVPIIEKELIDYKEILKSIGLDSETQKIINDVINLGDLIIKDEKYSWIEREFSSDYYVYALESLSRCEKNVRFVEYVVLSELHNKYKNEI